MDATTITSLASLILSISGLIVSVLTQIQHSECKNGLCRLVTVHPIEQPSIIIHPPA